MKKNRRVLSILFAFVIVISSLSPVAYAQQNENPTGIGTDFDYPTPYYNYLAAIYASIDTQEGQVIGNGLAVMLANKPMTLVMAFERSTDGIHWSTSGTYVKNTTGNGSKIIESSIAANSGYYYRFYFTVQVKDSSGRILETPSMVSKTIKV